MTVVQTLQTEIVPGEPAVAILEVEGKSRRIDDDQMSSRQLAACLGRRLSERVRLDGRLFRNRLTEGFANDVVTLQPVVVADAQHDSNGASVRVVATSYINAATEEFVFRTPGEHRLTFVGEEDNELGSLLIRVFPATPSETKVVQALDNHEVLSFLVDLNDCSHATAALVKQLTTVCSVARNTRLEKYVSVAVGAAKMCELRRMQITAVERAITADPQSSIDRSNYEEAVVELAGYFDSPLATTPTSDFDMTAMWYRASIETLNAKHASAPEAAMRRREMATKIVRQMRDSPLLTQCWLQKVEKFNIAVTPESPK